MRALNQSSDEELVIAFKDGNERAFEELYKRYSQKLYRIIYYYISDHNDIEDIFHEVIIRVLRHINNFNLSLVFSAWIYQIAINCCKNYLRSKSKKEVLINKEKFRMVTIDEKDVSVEQEVIADYEMKEFNHAIEKLAPKFKDVFLLRFDHKMKYAEIAVVLGCSERTVKWRMKRAVEKITLFLKNEGII